MKDLGSNNLYWKDYLGEMSAYKRSILPRLSNTPEGKRMKLILIEKDFERFILKCLPIPKLDSLEQTFSKDDWDTINMVISKNNLDREETYQWIEELLAQQVVKNGEVT